jgi:hypothetical protein
MSSRLVAAPLLLLVFAPTLGAADPAAQAAFDEGRRLMAAKKFDEACAKFEASQALEPLSGTLANLATCNEARGRVATAWAQWVDTEALAHQAHNVRREQLARDRITELRPRLPQLTIDVDPGLPGLEVRRNGEIVPAALLGGPFPVDPGAQRVDATAAGRPPWRAEVTAVEGKVETVKPWHDFVETTPPRESPRDQARVDVGQVPSDAPAREPPRRGSTALGVLGIATGVAGLAALALAVKFRADAVDASDEISRATSWSAALDQRVANGEAAQRNMYVCLGIGAGAVVTGALMTYLGFRSRAERPAVAASAAVGPGGPQFVVWGHF